MTRPTRVIRIRSDTYERIIAEVPGKSNTDRIERLFIGSIYAYKKKIDELGNIIYGSKNWNSRKKRQHR